MKKSPKRSGKRTAEKKKPVATIGNLINDAIRDTDIRSALYKNPRAVAKRYGLTGEEGKAMQILKRSLLSTLDRNQVKQLEAIIQMPSTGAGWGSCSPQTCVPNQCNPDVCNPNVICLPTPCAPNPCAPHGPA
jgi:hypothetical protein